MLPASFYIPQDLLLTFLNASGIILCENITYMLLRGTEKEEICIKELYAFSDFCCAL